MAIDPKKTSKLKVTKAKRKAWYTIVSPKGFNSIPIGETTAFEPESLSGRAVQVNLMSLTNDPRSQHVNITFKINKVVGAVAETEVFRYEIIPSHFKRLVRRNRERVDHSFLCKTKDGEIARVKFMIITRFTANKSVQSVLRKQATDGLSAIISKLSLEDAFKDIIFNKIQKLLRGRLAKITPLRNLEIKVLVLDPNKRGGPIITPSREALLALEAKKAPEPGSESDDGDQDTPEDNQSADESAD